MKGKEIIEIIKKDKLEEYEICFITDWVDAKDNGYISYENICICDIGVSDKEILLSGERRWNIIIHHYNGICGQAIKDNKCNGCQRLEDINFIGVQQCKYIQKELNWKQEKISLWQKNF